MFDYSVNALRYWAGAATAEKIPIEDEAQDVRTVPDSSSEDVKKGECLQSLRSLLLEPAGDDIAAQLIQGGELAEAEDLVSDQYLTRWLVARSWDVEDTFKSIREHAKWRVETMPLGYIPHEDVASELEANKLFLQGLDHQGRPVLIISIKNHSMWSRDLEVVKKTVCYMQEAAIRLADPIKNPLGQSLVIFDLTGIGMGCMDVPAMTIVLQLLTQHYVERLSKLIFYNAPYIFWGTWNSLSGLIPQKTREKIEMMYPTDTDKLTAMIPEDVLPQSMGGQAELLPVQNAMKRFHL